MSIGVFDSGLGGLTVLGALRERLPGQAFTYLGDNANAPYGTRSEGEIQALTRAGVSRLFEEGCDLVILACNTAAAVALRDMQEHWLPPGPRRVLGVLVPMIEAATGRPYGAGGARVPAPVARIGFFATPATVGSGAFPRELALRATGVEVVSIPCPGLVEALEGGRDPAPLVARFCAALRAAGPMPGAVILGCTHYPLAGAAFRTHLPGPRILSQPRIVADSLAEYLHRHPRFVARGRLRCLTTGDPLRVSARARALTGTQLTFAGTPPATIAPAPAIG